MCVLCLCILVVLFALRVFLSTVSILRPLSTQLHFPVLDSHRRKCKTIVKLILVSSICWSPANNALTYYCMWPQWQSVWIQLTSAWLIGAQVFPRIDLLEYIFNTPSLHRVHHGRNRYCIDKNYGAVFSIWDRMFGECSKIAKMRFRDTKTGDAFKELPG